MTDYIVYWDLVMDTSVYLVSYDGWIAGKNDKTQTVPLSLYLYCHCVKNKLKKTSQSSPCLLGCFHSALS